ncbi:MAG: ATP-binding protein [Pseudomonadota bacterium]
MRSIALVEELAAPARPAKHLMIFAGMVLMIVLGAPLAILFFCPAYLIWDYAFVYHIRALNRRLADVTRGQFVLILIHHGANVAGFATMSLIIAQLDWMPAAAIAHVMLVAQAFHNLAFDARSREAFLVSAVILTGYAQAILYVAVTQDLSLSLLTALHVAVLALSAFGTVAGLQANTMQLKLEDLTARLASAQKGETVGRLTSGIAHDFRNLLTVMRGNLDLLREVPEAEHAPLLNEIGAATERGERLTSRLLNTARQDRPDPETIDLDSFLSRFIAFAERVIPAYVALRLGNVERNLTIRASAAELEAALLNLVLNARDAMTGSGSIIIDAAKEQGADDTARVILSVHDNGPGMPPHLIDRISEPFVTTKAPDRGTGLGLAMVQAFAADIGGSLRIESAPGDGTTIQLNIPL